jgi:hypothetical protein
MHGRTHLPTRVFARCGASCKRATPDDPIIVAIAAIVPRRRYNSPFSIHDGKSLPGKVCIGIKDNSRTIVDTRTTPLR